MSNPVRVFVFVLLSASMVLAKPPKAATQPTTAPSARALAAATQPATQPATAQTKLPTPAELVAKLKKMKEQRAALSKVAYLDLSDAVTEKPAEFSLFGGGDHVTLRDLLERLHKARDDKDIRAVLLTLGAKADVNLAQAQEIRDALLELRQAGKKTFVYADSYDTAGYTIASGATNICMMEGGEIMIPGVGLETMFYKGTLDKVGVTADYIQIGEYKGAEEPYTRTAPSEELRGELNRLTESLYTEIIDGISLGRNLSTQAVRQMVDDTMMTGPVARERGFVDHLVDQDGLRALIKDELGNDIELLRDYGQPQREAIDFSNPFALLAMLSRKPEPTDKPAVALIYAQGVISDGDGQGGLFGEDGVGSEAMRKAIRTAARDGNIKAVVIRIDSPGGSALASEVMWQAVRRLSRESKKPVIISVGSMAASGGYYLASAGDYIFADPSGIVGSIGVVGGKFVLKDLYAKLGLSTEGFRQGRNAGLFSSTEKWSERQRRLVRTWMQQTYDQFTRRVMATRGGKIKDIDKVARGRIFLARQALELGMVDAIGGCDSAIQYAAGQAKLDSGTYEVRVLPAPRTLADLFSGHGSDEDALLPLRPRVTLSADSALLILPREVRQMVQQQLRMAHLLQQRPVVLMAPFTVSIR